MAFITFSPNTIIRSANINSNFAGIADGSELPNKTTQFFIRDQESDTAGISNYGDNEASADKQLCFRFNYSLFTNVQSIIFRTVLYGNGGAGNFYARLYNQTDGSALNNSEVTTNVISDNYNWIESADCKSDFAAGIKTYKIQMKQDNAAQGIIEKPQLVITWK